jgi:hypothetical protein
MLVKMAAALIIVSVAAAVLTAQDPDRIEVVLPRDAIPAIDQPEFESVSVADRVMADDELVIGVVGEREQRAYSTWQLDRHEIVNDVFEGRPIAVTW